ncbi:MAG: putative phosphodiesterase [Myxococcota bacterium]|jgi:predicted phosphodiesterase
MRIQLESDVHTEFHRDKGKSWVASLDPTGVDVLIVAGDLTTSPHLDFVLRGLCARFPDVIYVTGNHEYYGADRDGVHRIIFALQAELGNLHWLEDRAVTIGGQRFVGSTLWFRDDPDGLNAVYDKFLSDFKVIRGLRDWVYAVNERTCAFLDEQVLDTDVVITHHMPHPDGVAPIFRTGKFAPLNRFFLCDMTPLIERAQPKLWCFGHTHNAVDSHVGKTRLLCNPMGYPHEPDWGYRDGLVVDL